MESAESDILRGLNPAQREAVVNYDSPSLIIAGAGSGKTRVLTSRIAYMIEQGVDPLSVLALTFTNKAAEQMRERIAQMIPGNRSRLIRMGTFHSVFSRILRDNADRIGFQPTFTIYEPNDAKNLLKTIVRELNLNEDHYKPNKLASRISFAKNCLVTPGAYLAKTAYATEDRQAQIPEFGHIYSIYCQRCKSNNAMDFDDLLLQTNILLRDCPDVLARYQEQFQYILVDEYQDTNYAQYIIIRRLSALHSRVCVVGDDAQSIYSFRGAKIENILSFQKDFPTAKVFKLEQNYRSTRTIVEAANSVIAHNARRMEKHCFSEGDRGEPVRILRAYTDREEAEMVVRDLRDKLRETGDAWSEAVILYRTNKQSGAIEDSLRHHAVPYRIYKGSSFYDHKEIRDMLGYLRLIINPRDDEAFRRVVNYPARGIGDTTVERIAQLAQERGVSMWEAIDALVAEPVVDAMQKTIVRKVTEFVQLIRSLSLMRTEKGLYDFGLEVASRSGILALYRAENTPEAASALDNIEELLNSMQLFKEQVDAAVRNNERPSDDEATLEEWLQNIMLLTDMDKDDPEDRNKVTLMTVHSAKGLEYKYVYIVGVEENLFPSQRAMETPDGIEEERRLFYVALTRAKLAATLSYAESRFKWGNMEFSRPSCFLREIDKQYVQADFDRDDERPADSGRDAGESALDQLRRRFDYRFQQNGAGGFPQRGAGASHGDFRQRPTQGGGYRQRPQGGGFSAQGKGLSQRAQNGFSSQSRPTAPDPALVQTPRTSTAGMRSMGVRRKETSDARHADRCIGRPEGMPTGTTAGSCAYAVGDRVVHATFGEGVIRRIETLATDHKLVVDFGPSGEKTLLARFSKLIKT
ncbi:MAG: UvrD-helicase domain-containing protein [Alistipes sp.]|nr:UvrD-helicase domain-containing protein [Alistipes sp.]